MVRQLVQPFDTSTGLTFEACKRTLALQVLITVYATFHHVIVISSDNRTQQHFTGIAAQQRNAISRIRTPPHHPRGLVTWRTEASRWTSTAKWQEWTSSPARSASAATTSFHWPHCDPASVGDVDHATFAQTPLAPPSASLAPPPSRHVPAPHAPANDNSGSMLLQTTSSSVLHRQQSSGWLSKPSSIFHDIQPLKPMAAFFKTGCSGARGTLLLNKPL